MMYPLTGSVRNIFLPPKQVSSPRSHGELPVMAPGKDLTKVQLLLTTLGGPVSNLVLASAGISMACFFLGLDVLLWGAVVFGLYFFGLAMIYTIMAPALGLLGVSRMLRAVIALEGVVFVLLVIANLV